jgi:hypothetical protein
VLTVTVCCFNIKFLVGRDLAPNTTPVTANEIKARNKPVSLSIMAASNRKSGTE